VNLTIPLATACALIGLGLYGVVARRNAVLLLMSAELVLAGAGLIAVALDAARRDPVLGGQVLALVIITIAAAEVGLALAVLLLRHRLTGSVAVDEPTGLGEADATRADASTAGATTVAAPPDPGSVPPTPAGGPHPTTGGSA
jgi:NADH-quinone oxidoreductase subunit K